MFGDAEAYERFMGRWSAALAPAFLDAVLGTESPVVVCDVGCGTGNLTGAVLQRNPGTRVVGVDPSPPFVAAAESRYGGPGRRFVVGRADDLPVPDGQVDAALASLVLNFVPEPAAAVREMVRVTRRGGVVGATVWDYADGMTMLRVFWDAAAALRPGVQDQTLDRPAETGGLEALLDRAGLGAVVGGLLEVPMAFPTFEDFWQPFLEGIGPAGAYVAGLGDGERVAVRAELVRRLGPGPIEMTSTARWAAGRVQDDTTRTEGRDATAGRTGPPARASSDG